MKKIITTGIILLFGILLIVFDDISHEAAVNSLNLCAFVIIPGLFPFMVLGSLAVSCGGARVFARILGEPFKRIFGLEKAAALPFIIGIISGYPVGSVVTAEMVKSGELSRSSGEKVLGFCNNPGPMFVMGSVAGMAGLSKGQGVVLWASQIIAAVITGIIIGKTGIKTKNEDCRIILGQKQVSVSETFVGAVKEGVKSIITICGFVVFFSVVIDILIHCSADRIFVNWKESSHIKALLSGLIETTSGCKAAGLLKAPPDIKAAFISMLLGWSGLCVHAQVTSAVRGSGMTLKPYFKGKILQTLISPVITFFGIKLVSETVQTSVSLAPRVDYIKLFSLTFICCLAFSICILLISSVFLCCRKSVKK